MMPNGKAYVDLDVVVVDPRTSVVKWAGQARSKIDSGTSWGATPEEKGQQLTTALRTALEKCFSRADFTQAFDTTANKELPGCICDRSPSRAAKWLLTT